jgi:PAS domain S-box-containing protein
VSWRYLLRVVVLALAYYAAARLGLLVTMVSDNVSPIFPATGIALVGLLLFGYRLWPGIALGALWATAPSTSLVVGLSVAVGKTLEATLAVYLMRRFVGFGRSLDRLQDVLALVFFGAVLSSAVGATIGVASLCLGNFAAWEAFSDLWWVWWVGDAMGVLLVAPFVLVWVQPVRIQVDIRRVAEIAALSFSLLLASELAFGGYIASPTLNLPFVYLPFPFVIWAALRFGQPGAVTAAQLASIQAIVGTALGYGPFARESVLLSLILLQAYLAAVIITALVLGAVTTERQRGQEALLAGEKKLREQFVELEQLYQTAPVALYLMDRERRFVRVNERLAAFTGQPVSEYIGRRLRDVAPQIAEKVDPIHQRVFETGEPVLNVEIHGATEVWSGTGLSSYFPLKGEDGTVQFVSSVVQDITARKRAEEALRASAAALRESHEKTQDLAGKLIVAQEEERRRLSREIHDGLNQQLAALSFEISKLRGGLPEDRERIREQLAVLQDRTAGVIDDARDMSYELHPSTLEYLGLAAALKSYCCEFGKQEQIKARLTIVDVPESIPRDVALCLYRVAQEGLRNVARHSGAREVRVALVGTGEGIELSIVDAGQGFDTDKAARKNGGLGLVSMGERVRLLGGELVIESKPQAGTQLRVRIPVSAAQREARS